MHYFISYSICTPSLLHLSLYLPSHCTLSQFSTPSCTPYQFSRQVLQNMTYLFFMLLLALNHLILYAFLRLVLISAPTSRTLCTTPSRTLCISTSRTLHISTSRTHLCSNISYSITIIVIVLMDWASVLQAPYKVIVWLFYLYVLCWSQQSLKWGLLQTDKSVGLCFVNARYQDGLRLPQYFGHMFIVCYLRL